MPRILLCCLCLCFTALSAEESRGLKPLVVKAQDGREIVRFTSHHALVIGNSRYTAGWPPLAGVAEDVAAVRGALERQGFAVEVANDLNRTQMDERISAFVAEKGQDPNGRIVFYYAGHGQTLKNNQGQENGYLVPVDAPVPTEATRPAFIAKAYPIQRIKIAAQELGCRHALAVFDACFSGALFAPLRGGSEAILQQAAEPVRMFITSGSADEQVPDTSVFREEFVAALNDGVADANKDGWTTGSELALYLRQQVMGRRAAAGGKQTPQAGISEQSGLNKGDIVFANGASTSIYDSLTLKPKPAPAPAEAARQAQLDAEAARAAQERERTQKLRAAGLISGAEADRVDTQATSAIVATGAPGWAANAGSDAIGRWAEIAVGPATQRLRLVPAGGGIEQLWVADSECTQRLWQAVMGANPSTWTGRIGHAWTSSQKSDQGLPSLPVESVSWDDIQTFLGKLNTAVPGLQARLPTEAEWAWSAAAGQAAPADLDPLAWTRTSGVRNPQEVRTRQANAFGLHDMLGNVWEWCADPWMAGTKADPQIERLLRLGRTREQAAGAGAERRAMRGGGFLDKSAAVNADLRQGEKPGYTSRDLGFRFVVGF